MQGLQRRLSLYGLTMIVIGSCIGSGIFITPSDVASYLQVPIYILLVWLAGGIVSMFGALSFSELGGMYPKSGGVYVYLKEAYGPLVGFLYGWVMLLIINTGALAALSIAFADFLSFFYEFSQMQKQIIGILLICGLTAINLMGVSVSQLLASTFSGIKILAIIVLLIVGLFFGTEGKDIFSLPAEASGLGIKPILFAFVGVFWSFGGWHHATYLSGEAIKPQRNVPRSIVFGTLAVTLLYVFANIAYLLLLPMPEVTSSTRIAGDAVAQVISGGGKIVTVLISISIFGTIAIYTMSAPRIYFAMANDKVFFSQLAKIHKKYKTPHIAMIFQAVWACLLILFWGSFIKVITFVTFMDIVFMMLAGLALFILRKKKPDMQRPVKVIGYPVIPFLYVLVTGAFVINLIISMSAESLFGLVILFLGIPVYFYFRKQNIDK